MKNSILFMLLLTLLLFNATAQNNPVESARVAFISQRINLTPVQAEKFWPLYNELNDQRSALKKSIRQTYEKMTTDPTSEKIKSEIETIHSLKQKEGLLEKEYYLKFLLILTPAQVGELATAEREFQKILLKKISSGE